MKGGQNFSCFSMSSMYSSGNGQMSYQIYFVSLLLIPVFFYFLSVAGTWSVSGAMFHPSLQIYREVVHLMENILLFEVGRIP